MQIFVQEITFGASPVGFSFADANGNPITHVSRLYAEPATSNPHDCFIEQVGTASGADGSTAGVIKRLPKPPAANGGSVVDHWEISDQKGGNLIDVGQYQADGTSGEQMRVTCYVG